MNYFRLYLSVLFLFFNGIGGAKQNAQLDSVRHALMNAKTDSVTIGSLLYKAVNAVSYTKEVRLEIAHWVLVQSEKKGLKSLVGDCKIFIGQIYLGADEYEEANKYFIRAVEYGRKIRDVDIQIKALFLQGNVFYANKQYKKSEEVDLECLRLSKKYKHTKYLFEIYNGLGILRYKSAGSDEGLKAKAVELFKKSFKYILPEMLENKAYAYQNLAGLFAFDNKPDSALVYLKLTEPVLKELNYPKDVCSHYHLFLGVALQGKKRYKEALENFKIGLTYANSIHSPKMRYEYYLEISRYYEELGQNKMALDYLKKYHAQYDSVVNIENFARAVDIRNKYENEKRERHLIELTKDNQVRTILIGKKTNLQKWLYGIIASIVLGVLLLSYLVLVQVRNIKRRKISYNLLQTKNIEIEQKASQLLEQSKLIGTYQGQMSPSFIFDSVKVINETVESGNRDKSILQLQGFSGLMRQTLAFSEKEWITFEEEHAFITKYMDFEKNEANRKFDFTITYKFDFDESELLVPHMLIQPFLEFAIGNCKNSNFQNEEINLFFKAHESLLEIDISETYSIVPGSTESVAYNNSILVQTRARMELMFHTSAIQFSDTYFITSSHLGCNQVKLFVPLKFRY